VFRLVFTILQTIATTNKLLYIPLINSINHTEPVYLTRPSVVCVRGHELMVVKARDMFLLSFHHICHKPTLTSHWVVIDISFYLYKKEIFILIDA